MTKTTLYFCKTDGWQGTKKECSICAMATEPKEVPKRRAGLYFIQTVDYPLPSVTEILKSLAKPALMTWAAKTAATAALLNPCLSVDQAVASIYAKRDKAGSEGSDIHRYIEWIEANKPFSAESLPEKLQNYISAFTKFKKSFPYKGLLQEQTVYSLKHGYAGTIDRLVEDSSGKKWLLDWKTSNYVYPEMGLQLAAYKQALEEMGQPVDHMAVVHLKDNGTYSLIEMDEPLSVFLALKHVSEWSKS